MKLSILSEMDRSLRQSSRSKDLDKNLLNSFRSGRISPEAIKILAGLDYKPAVAIANQYFPPRLPYDKRHAWKPANRIEVALREGGDLGIRIGTTVMLEIVQFIKQRSISVLLDHDELTDQIGHICDFLMQQNPSDEIFHAIDNLIGTIEISRYYQHDLTIAPAGQLFILDDEQRNNATRLVKALGMVASWYKENTKSQNMETKFYFVGNALTVCADFGFNFENLRQEIIKSLL